MCLRVTDDDGRREATGEVVRVDADDASALEPASEPRSAAVDALANVRQGPYWLLRSLLPFRASDRRARESTRQRRGPAVALSR